MFSSFVRNFFGAATAQNIVTALQQSAVFFTSFWLTSGAIFAHDIWNRVAPRQREWNAYAPARRSKILKTVFFNLLVSMPVWFFAIASIIPWVRQHNTSPLVSLPQWYKLMLMTVSVDICFYVLHRIAHLPYIYARIHKKHHEITLAFGPSAVYCNVLEMWFVNMLSGTIPLLLFLPSDTVVLLTMAISAADTVIAHSRWSSLHYQHHRYPRAVFGSTLGIVDHLFSSYVGDLNTTDAMRKVWSKVTKKSTVHPSAHVVSRGETEKRVVRTSE